MQVTQVKAIAVIATKNIYRELLILLHSLRLFAPDVPIYLLCDSYIKHIVSKQSNFNVKYFEDHELNELSDLSVSSQKSQTAKGAKQWNFLMQKKLDVLRIALRHESNVLLMDADMCLTCDISNILKGKEQYDVVLSRHDSGSHTAKTYGIYNAGSLWTRSSKFVEWWKNEISKSSKGYFEQTALNKAHLPFKVGSFSSGYNVGPWKYRYAIEQRFKVTLFPRPRAKEDSRTLIRRIEPRVRKLKGLLDFPNLQAIHAHTIYNDPSTTFSGKITQLLVDDFLSKLEQNSNQTNNGKHRELLTIIRQSKHGRAENSRKLTVVCANGLVNRLFSLFNGLYLAKKYKKRLVIYWKPDHWCDCQFKDLFQESPKLFTVVETIDVTPDTYIFSFRDKTTTLKFFTESEKNIVLSAGKCDFAQPNRKLCKLPKDVYKQLKTKHVCLFSFTSLVDITNSAVIKELFSTLKLAPVIKRALAANAHISRTISGFHLRGTDLMKLFISQKEIVRREIKTLISRNKKFLICTDDQGLYQEFVHPTLTVKVKYPHLKLDLKNSGHSEQFVTNSSIVHRSREQVICGLIDLVLLSRSNLRWHSPGSSFGRLANFLN